MGQSASLGDDPDFSDTPPDELVSFTLANNLYWNGGSPLPDSGADAVNPSDDASAIEANPMLADPSDLAVPRWDEVAGRFADGSATICEAHLGVVETYATPGESSMALGAADSAQSPDEDILGRARGASSDVGAVEVP